MADTSKINELLSSLSKIDESDNALLKIIPEYKFHGSHIVGNEKGLLRLAKAALEAALSEPSKHEIRINRPTKPETDFPSFGVASIERDENLEYKPTK